MNYYYDCEFLEGSQKEDFPISLFRKNTPPTIDLISIGIVAEDGREYYAISKDFNLKEAWNRYDVVNTVFNGDLRNQYPNGRDMKVYWIRDNVLKPIWIDLFLNYEAEFTFLKGKAYDVFESELKAGTHDKYFTFKSVKALIDRYGKSNKQISEEIRTFITGSYKINEGYGDYWSNPEFVGINLYGYYSAYDHVALCWLFGKMINLPKGFPMYTRDLKQMMDEKAESLKWMYGRDCWSNSNRSVSTIGTGDCQEKDRDASFEEKIKTIKELNEYPKQENEHSAIDDARWNKKLHEFINSL